MPFIITNPWGLLALLGVPVVLCIHFLQRRARIVPCSTLFLLHQTQRESLGGRKVERIVNSISLWLQLLMVVLLTVVLLRPIAVNNLSTQRIAIVLDSSASMDVFKEDAKLRLLEEIPKLKGNAPHFELWVMDSNITKDRIYYGNSLDELELKLDNWKPTSGTYDPNQTLRVARSLIGHQGKLVYFTDTRLESIAYGAEVFSIGNNRSNVGFTGAVFEKREEGLFWKATIKNYSKDSSTRSLTVKTDQAEVSEPQEIILAPGELKVVSSLCPPNSLRLSLHLSDDDFTLDNTLPLIKPLRKVLHIHHQCEGDYTEVADKVIKNFDNVVPALDSENADLKIHTVSSIDKKIGRDHAIVFLAPKQINQAYVNEEIIPSADLLVEGMNWSSLALSTMDVNVKLTGQDTVLVWAGKTPLIILREVVDELLKVKKQLIFNFDINGSNGMKVEAFPLLIYRFIDIVRQEKSTVVQLATELNQPLKINNSRFSEKVLTREETDIFGNVIGSTKIQVGEVISASEKVGFYSIRRGDDIYIQAANYYADTREANLQECSSGILQTDRLVKASDSQAKEDHLWRLWLILVMVVLLVSWASIRK